MFLVNFFFLGVKRTSSVFPELNEILFALCHSRICLKSQLTFLFISFKELLVVYCRAIQRTFQPQQLKNFHEKYFFYFFLKKTVFKKFLIFSQKSPPLIFRKRNFLIFRERYTQSPDIFRIRSIFRTHGIFKTRGIFPTLSNIFDGKFCKTQLPSALFDLNPQNVSLKKPALKNVLIFCQKKAFFTFLKMKIRTFRSQLPKFSLKNFLQFSLKNLL